MSVNCFFEKVFLSLLFAYHSSSKLQEKSFQKIWILGLAALRKVLKFDRKIQHSKSSSFLPLNFFFVILFVNYQYKRSLSIHFRKINKNVYFCRNLNFSTNFLIFFVVGASEKRLPRQEFWELKIFRKISYTEQVYLDYKTKTMEK